MSRRSTSARSRKRAASSLIERAAHARRARSQAASVTNPARTILDVLREFEHGLGVNSARAYTLDSKQIARLADDVVGFYQGWSASVRSEELTVHPALPLNAFNPAASSAPARQTVDPQQMLTSLLYYPRIVVADPLHDMFNLDKRHLTLSTKPPSLTTDGWYMDFTEASGGAVNYLDSRQPVDEVRESVRRTLLVYESLAPLIEAGVIILAPQWKIVREHQSLITAAVEADRGTGIPQPGDFYEALTRAKNYSANDFGAMEYDPSPMGGDPYVHASAASFYLNKTLAVASAVGGVYAPRSWGDQRILSSVLDRLSRDHPNMSRQVLLPSIDTLSIPAFSRLDAATLLRVRQDETAFADFRAMLQRLIVVGQTSSDDPREWVTAYVREQLNASVAQVERAITNSSTLRRAAATNRRDIVLGALGAAPGVVAASPAGWPAAVGAGVASVALEGMGAVLYDMFSRPRLEGAQLIISGLLRPKN